MRLHAAFHISRLIRICFLENVRVLDDLTTETTLEEVLSAPNKAITTNHFGDVLAWLASLANQMDVSLDEAMQRYVDDPP